MIRITVSDFDIFSLGLGLVIDTETFSVSVSSLRLRHFQSRSRSSKSCLAYSCFISVNCRAMFDNCSCDPGSDPSVLKAEFWLENVGIPLVGGLGLVGNMAAIYILR